MLVRVVGVLSLTASQVIHPAVPKDQKTIRKWESAIPRKHFTLKSGQVVFQKHFTSDDIVWKKEVKDPEGNVMASVSKCFDL